MVSLNKALTAAAAIAAPPLVEFKTILGRSVEISLFLLFSTPINQTGIPIIKLGKSFAFSKISIK